MYSNIPSRLSFHPFYSTSTAAKIVSALTRMITRQFYLRATGRFFVGLVPLLGNGFLAHGMEDVGYPTNNLTLHFFAFVH